VKKVAVYAPREAALVLNALSKQAILDIAWNLALLGTDESPDAVLIKVAHEAALVCKGRGDRLPPMLAKIAECDPEGCQ
jgi:hypothetical protein